MRSCPRLFISAALMKAAWTAASADVQGQKTCHAKPTARKTSVLLQQGQMKFKVAKLDVDGPKVASGAHMDILRQSNTEKKAGMNVTRATAQQTDEVANRARGILRESNAEKKAGMNVTRARARQMDEDIGAALTQAGDKETGAVLAQTGDKGQMKFKKVAKLDDDGPKATTSTCSFVQSAESGSFPQPHCHYGNFEPICNQEFAGKSYYGNHWDVGGGDAQVLSSCIGGWLYHGAKSYDRKFTCTCPQANYELITAGSCTYGIHTLAECGTAATVLGLSDNTPVDDGQDAVSYDPPFCYFEGGSLKFNVGGFNKGLCSSSDKCLCQVMQTYKYIGCYSGNSMVRPVADVPSTVAGVQSCRDQCASRGYEYFGFECPHQNGQEVHCECGTGAGATQGTAHPQQKCKEFNGGGAHCTGPFVVNGAIGEYVLGAANMGSVYAVDEDAKYTEAGSGVAGPTEIWNVGGAQGKGVDACYEAVSEDPRCNGYFTYVHDGDLNCGCKGSAGELAVRTDGVSTYYQYTPKISKDPANNGKKCGHPDDTRRIFDKRGSAATSDDCIAACSSDSRCEAFSAIWGEWCIGCTTPLDTPHPKAEAFKMVPSSLQSKLDLWCQNLGTDDDVVVGTDHWHCNTRKYARFDVNAHVWRCYDSLSTVLSDACVAADGTATQCYGGSGGWCTQNAELEALKYRGCQVCPAGYSYSHAGRWSNADNMLAPLGRVIVETPGTTTHACAAKCNDVATCIAFSLYRHSDCTIYDTLGTAVDAGPNTACVKATHAGEVDPSKIVKANDPPRYHAMEGDYCQPFEYINNADVCREAAKAMALPTAMLTQDTSQTGEGCRYENGKLVFRERTHRSGTVELTMDCSRNDNLRCGIVDGRRTTCYKGAWCSRHGWCGWDEEYRLGAQLEFSNDAEGGCSNAAYRGVQDFCTMSSHCICYTSEEVKLWRETGGQPDRSMHPEFVRLQRCNQGDTYCEYVDSNSIMIKDDWRRAFLESDFECPLKGLVVVRLDWNWKRQNGDPNNMEVGYPKVSMLVNGKNLMDGLTGNNAFQNGAFTAEWYVEADGNVLSMRSGVEMPAAGQGNVDELRGKVTINMATAYIACEDVKACIKTLDKDHELRVDNAKQLACLGNEGPKSDVCRQWQECVQASGAEPQLLILLRAAVLFPDDEEDVELAQAAHTAALARAKQEAEEEAEEVPRGEPGAPLAQVKGEDIGATLTQAGDKEAASVERTGAALAQADDKEGCTHPEYMDTEAWYCLCIDEMQKACHEISPKIRKYDETKCLQANGCYDPFNVVCPSWKNDKMRCKKLKVYTDELEKHQRASLVQRANHTASGAAGGAALLDNTVTSKTHQCNH